MKISRRYIIMFCFLIFVILIPFLLVFFVFQSRFTIVTLKIRPTYKKILRTDRTANDTEIFTEFKTVQFFWGLPESTAGSLE